MKTLYAVTLVIIASFGLGILAGQSLAQIAPPAYVVTLFDAGLKSATDTDYPSLNPATFSRLAVTTSSILGERLASMGVRRIDL